MKLDAITSLIRPYWQSAEKKSAIALLGLIISLSIGEVLITVKLNEWNNQFYNSLQNYNWSLFKFSLWEYGKLISYFTAVFVAGNYTVSLLEIRWRRWLNQYIIKNWLESKQLFLARFAHDKTDNIDQRISEDVTQFVSLTLFLGVGFFKNILTLWSFIVILWGLSIPFQISIMHHKLVIPGALLWLAVIYSFISTYIAFKLGAPLKILNYRLQKNEADYRRQLIRVNDDALPISAYQGRKVEQSTLNNKFTEIYQLVISTIRFEAALSIFNTINRQIAVVFPILISARNFFNREITFGSLMQLSSAFSRVQLAIAYFAFIYPSVASWHSVMSRLLELNSLINTVEEPEDLKIITNDDRQILLKLRNVSVFTPQKKPLLENLNFSITAGQRLLIMGAAGTGKSSLLKVLNGFWPFASGEIISKKSLHKLYVTQQPFISHLSLRDNLTYPLSGSTLSDELLQKTLTKVGLSYLVDQLHIDFDSLNNFSLGEKQKLACARILLLKPELLFLDEISSSLSENEERLIYQTLITELPQTAIISVGHRSSLEQYHHMVLKL